MFSEPSPQHHRSAAPVPPNTEHALAQWIAGQTRAHVLVDDALRVRWMNPAAERLMSRPNSLLIRNGHIRSRENRFDHQLRTLIQEAAGLASMCCVHDAKTGENLLLSATRLPPPFEDCVGLTMADASEDYRFHLGDLHSAFGLTQTEVRVASRLLGGRTADETAQDFGIALETVRTHIKRAYAKLGVCSREAFFHKLAPFMIILD